MKPRGTIRRRVKQAARSLWGDAYAFASRRRKLATTAIYSVLALLAYFTAFQLRFDFVVPAEMMQVFVLTVPLLLVLRLGTSYAFGISRGRWRFVSTQDVRRLVVAALTASTALLVLTWGLPVLPYVPRSVIVIDLVLYTCFTAAVWILYRTTFEQLRARNGHNGASSRVLIVGAGEAGSLLAREMLRSSIRRVPVGFVDDDPTKWGSMLHGLHVIGGTEQLPELAARYHVQEIVIAVPSATPSQLRRIVQHCEETDLAFNVLPGLAEVLEGRVQWSQVRPLRIEDLLGREPIALDLPELRGELQGRCVLITGAAGSIGSELARQVARHSPGKLILLDQAETGLFNLARELAEQYPQLSMRFVVSNTTDDVAVDSVFGSHRPSHVFHAAAYKHVTMMQTHVREAIRNNVLGTLYVGSAAAKHGAKKFVFVSTDKAVEPTSVMGATKRLAEMLVIELQERFPETFYAAVRFGNVLGSNGSVLPIFRSQIEAGKPLTITHPDATRYFMMIPEAVQLILQASLLAEVRGQIAMLDMGEPVRIMDLARNLLRIAGLPHRNGKMIVVTGLHEGEKLHEKLLAPGEHTIPTRIDKVHIVVPEVGQALGIVRLLARWELAFREGRHDEVVAELFDLFPGLRGGIEVPGPPLRQAV